MDSKELLQQQQNRPGFLQLVPNDADARSAVSRAVGRQAEMLRIRFAENVHALFPDSDMCSLLFSLHALIDHLFSYVTSATYHFSPQIEQVVHDLMIGFGFLFYETSDPFRPSGQWSFSDKYLNQAELFRPPEKDFIFAMEYAIGLGVEGCQTAFYTETAKCISQDMYLDKRLPSRIRRVWCVYRLAGAILHITPSEVLQKVREGIRKYCAVHDFRTTFTSNSDEDLYRALSQFFLREQREKRFRRVLRRSSNISKRTYHRGTVRKRQSHLYVAIMGIETLDELLHRIAHIFIRTFNSRTENRKILSADRFSQEQLNLILPEQWQIALSDDQDYTLPQVWNCVCSNHASTQSALSEYDSETFSKEERRSYERLKGQQQKNSFKLSDWPAVSSDYEKQVIPFGQLIAGFHGTLYSSVYHKKIPRHMSDADVRIFLDFVMNENLFAIDCEDNTVMPLAPLVAYSMLLSKTHQIRSFCSKAWDLQECLAKRPLSAKRQKIDMIHVHLYIQLRSFFTKILNADDRTIIRWDCLFREMTGYNDFYMLYLGSLSNKVQWRADNLFGDFYRQVDFSLWSIGPVLPEHKMAYLRFREQDKKLDSKSMERVIQEQVQNHPVWTAEYRKNSVLPWYAGDHTDFLKACLNECGFSEQPWKNMIEYPHDNTVHPKDRLKSKYFPQMLLELNLQQAMLDDSNAKWHIILHKVFPEDIS